MQPGPAHSARASLIATGGVAAVLLVVVLGTWAASIGPSSIFSGPGVPRGTRRPDLLATTPPTGQDGLPPHPGRGSWAWLEVVGYVVQAALLVAFVFLVVRGLSSLRIAFRERRRPDPPAEAVAFDVLDEPGLLARELARDAARRRELLGEGDPRNGIVRCWHQFEVGAGRVGLRREPWQTPAEFTLRLLDVAAADGTAVMSLAGLYREARFSEHEVTEADRAAALDALGRIDASLLAVRVR